MKPLSRLGSLIAGLALASVSFAGRAASATGKLVIQTASVVLTVPATTQVGELRAGIKRALMVALGSASVVGGLSAAFTYMATDQQFLLAVAPALQVLCAKAGFLAVPTPALIAVLTFVLAHIGTLLALAAKGKVAPTPFAGQPMVMSQARVVGSVFAPRIVVTTNYYLEAEDEISRIFPAASFEGMPPNGLAIVVHPFGQNAEILFDVDKVAGQIADALARLNHGHTVRVDRSGS